MIRSFESCRAKTTVYEFMFSNLNFSKLDPPNEGESVLEKVFFSFF